MRSSELVARSGVPLATIKYYLLEGLLMPGKSTSATQSTYGDDHLERLSLIKALAGAGLPIDRIRNVLELIEHPAESLYETLGNAIAELPPVIDHVCAEYPRAEAVLAKLGQIYDPCFVAVAQLERALQAAEDVGIPMTDQRLTAYGTHLRGIAEAELAMMPIESTAAAVEYAVLGTAIYEPVITALRRLTHQHLAQKISTPP
ncbi:MerR family transcriptional regulator [Rhodococcus sp. PAMC28707]|uniref:MerR family transcriptional regulator n=1 Tax=unclassified Rhodococcus (in: high G+C Gram-positive bacteria) TaxID=192944 RepID=UPI00109DB63D|nr:MULTISPECIES: MerR family transcriptional regulator [unclassified Rhodococcus (in: high G+C Gram-positive bacteria)]QCB48906.1 MerR family transcriptional regulator [Rhodococcus sp. PAMC28705]QCB59407.1 MerR family transcriptional regulator [Rhodococcus sp. PAMC28707]